MFRTMKKYCYLLLFSLLCSPVFAQQNGYRQGCYPTIWPTDMANLNRTGCVVNGGLPQNFDTARVRLSSISLPYPVFTYTRAANEIFVLGGTPYLLDTYVKVLETGTAPAPNLACYAQFTPYLARFNPSTNQVVQVALAGGIGSPYVGGALMHANGLVYAVAKGRLFKIAPATMTVLGFVDLPVVGSAFQTNYNGLAVTDNGRLVLKAFGATNGVFVLVDQNNLTVLNRITIPNGSPRLCLAKEPNGRLYLYHLTQTQTFRLEIRNDTLIPDANWTAAYNPYHDGSVAEPLSPVVFDQKVVYTTNTVYTATRPTKFFWQTTNQNYSSLRDTLRGQFPTADSLTTGFSFFHLNVDDTLSRNIVINDQGAHRICAVRLVGQSLLRLWSRPYNTSAKPAIVADRGLLYINDFRNGRDYLVVLNLLTGAEVYRVRTPALHPTIATIIVGTQNDVYYASNEPYQAQGFLHRIYYALPTGTGRPQPGQTRTAYPNPVSRTLTLDTQTGYQLFNATGALVRKFAGRATSVDVGELPSGLYLLKSDGATMRFLKE